MEEIKESRFKALLIKEKEELAQRIERLDQGLGQAMTDSLGELSMYDNHPADIGDELFERGKDLALKDTARIEYENVLHALEKIEEGTFGRCDKCGGAIGAERLHALPWANLCLKCKKDETGPDRTPRPIEEEVVSPPYGETHHLDMARKFGDGDNQPIFDGEDAWQAVARFGSSNSPQDLGETDALYPNVYDDWDEERDTRADVDHIPYERAEDGLLNKDFRA